MIKDGNVQCPYHGLEFDGTGRCVHNPHGTGARPSALNVRAFPLVERDGLVWLWSGAKALADETKIPDFSARIDPKRRNVGGRCTVECHYQLMVDNLMDLGHFQYVHRSNAAIDGFDNIERKVVVENGTITNLMSFPSATPNVLALKFLDFDNRPMHMWTDMTWHPVSAMQNFIAFAIAGTPKEESLNTYGTHIVTPETATSAHYFYGASRNFALDDSAVDQAYRDWQKQALTLEDKPITEAIQTRLPLVQRMKLAPSMLACDEAAVRVSREIERLTIQEAA
jgi:phenylpropionate dioxygenase-like ring-hydroxylating dioxygenase large terminal subunit